jgi:hypothetical protein
MSKGTLYHFIFFVLVLKSCATDPYDPNKFLEPEVQQKIIRQTVYYSMKLAPNASQDTKFDKDFDWYYDRAAKEVEFTKYFIDEKGDHYFLMSRVARSITPMREGIGGKIRVDASGKLNEYEEIFRTWKMESDSLKIRGAMLFDRMVKGKDLSLFYAKFQGDKYIEFPNERFSFDKKLRLWQDNAIDTLKVE